MTDERLIELALGSEAATAEESVAMAMRLLNWHQTEKGGPMLEDFNIFSAKSMKEFHESKTMNHASTEIVATITEAIVFPNIGLTLTQEEADAIKEYVRTRFFEDNIQGVVHSGFARRENEQTA